MISEIINEEFELYIRRSEKPGAYEVCVHVQKKKRTDCVQS